MLTGTTDNKYKYPFLNSTHIKNFPLPISYQP